MPDTWKHFQEHFYMMPEIGLQIDLSRMGIDEKDFPEGRLQEMFSRMQQLEQGAVSNPDENRMVGHYWLRNPETAPAEAIRRDIEQTRQKIEAFCEKIHTGTLRSETGKVFTHMLVVGIGGSALGPCFAVDALKGDSGLKAYFMDNTDPDGMDRIFSALKPVLEETLTIVISKSGSTAETYNGMMETRHFYEQNGLSFARHAVAVTREGSQLYRLYEQEQWLEVFPMWDWVGGRTSVTSAVGLLPLTLSGADTRRFLEGAKQADSCTRRPVLAQNPAALLAVSWHLACKKQGRQQMIILPYKDRLALLTAYLQQLVMESLGKELDRDGNTVHEGIAVWGRKGTSDQHSYMQQLLEGPDDFFLTFIEILQDREGDSPIVQADSTSGDYLQAFLLGSREAVLQKGRTSLTLTLQKADAFHLGALIALYERAVGFYAELVNINAYHQPAVELGKKSAQTLLQLKKRIFEELKNHPGQYFTVEELAERIGAGSREEWIFKLLQHMQINQPHIMYEEKAETLPQLWQARYGYAKIVEDKENGK